LTPLVFFKVAVNEGNALIRTNNPPSSISPPRQENLNPLPSPCSGEVDESSFYVGRYELNANFEDGGTGFEIMHFWYWVMLHPSIGKGIMATNAECNATTG